MDRHDYLGGRIERKESLPIPTRATATNTRIRRRGGFGVLEDEKGELNVEEIMQRGRTELDDQSRSEDKQGDQKERKGPSKRTYDLRPIDLKELEKKIVYSMEDVKEDRYAIIQDRRTRFLVKITNVEGKDSITAQYMRSWEHPKEAKRKFQKVWWDPVTSKEILGGNATKYTPYELTFDTVDIYVIFKELENKNIPETVRAKWKEWYGEEIICT